MAEYRNVIRSKKLIRQAFANMLQEKKDISKVTVKGIVERAHISKSTFYCHYQDIYAVIEEFEQEILDLLDQTLGEYINTHQKDFRPFIEKIVLTLGKNEALYKMLISNNNYGCFIEKMKTICINRLTQDIKLEVLADDPQTRYTEITILTNGIVYTIVDYFKGNIKTTPEELAKLFDIILIKATR